MSNTYIINYEVESNADGTKTCTVKWIIKGFNNLLTDVKENARYISDLCTNTADCADNGDEDTKFLFKIVFSGKKKGYIEIYYLVPAPMSLKYSVYNKNGEIVKVEYPTVQPNKWQILVCINWTAMDYINNISKYLYGNGELYLCFEFTIKKEIIKEIKVHPSHKLKAELNIDLENMLNNSMYSDVTILSAEGVEFQTHKGVLAARSVVLKALFESNMLENQTNIINTCFETEVLQEVLRYIYTDNTPEIDKMPEKLFAAADYYQLNRLKYLCEEELFKKLTVENAITLLEIADLHSSTNLKKSILNFICNGRLGLIKKTKAWKELQSADIAKTILEYISKSTRIK